MGFTLQHFDLETISYVPPPSHFVSASAAKLSYELVFFWKALKFIE